MYVDEDNNLAVYCLILKMDLNYLGIETNELMQLDIDSISLLEVSIEYISTLTGITFDKKLYKGKAPQNIPVDIS